MKIRILEAALILSVDTIYINSVEVTASDMVFGLPPNHRNYKAQTVFAIGPPLGPPTQNLGACLAYHVCCPRFILVTRFNTKISMVSMPYETWLPLRSNVVFSTNVAEHVGLNSSRSSG